MSRARLSPRTLAATLALGALSVSGIVSGVVTAAPATAAGNRPATGPATGPAAVASSGPRTPSDPAAQVTTGMMPATSPDAVHRGSPGAAHAAIMAPAVSYVQGVDIASYQHPSGRAITWSSVRAGGQSFTVIKADEGNYYTNAYLPGDAVGARAAGLTVGLYHFARPSLVGGSPTPGALAEADHFAASIRAISGAQLPPTLDLEEYDGLSAPQLVAWTATFLERVQSDTGRQPMIYTSPGFWNYYLAGSRSFAGYPLWEAQWTTAAAPQQLGGWASWTFWQFTDGVYGSPGSVPGIPAVVDRDRYVSSLTQMQSLAAASNGNVAPYTGTASRASYPDGMLVQITGTSPVYQLAGLAPVYLNRFSDLLPGSHVVHSVSYSQFFTLRSTPLDGTLLRVAQTRQVYRVAGGAPIYLTTWAPFGGVTQPTVQLDQEVFTYAGYGSVYAHLSAKPANGTFLAGADSGQVYRVAGGAPVYLSSWTYFGGVQPYVSITQAAISGAGTGLFSHLAYTPAEGTAISDPYRGTYWVVSGGRLVQTTSVGRVFTAEGDTAIAYRGLPGVWSHLH